MIVNSTTYRCFATFTKSATTYYLGTDNEYRAGNWYEPKLIRNVQIAQQFEIGGFIEPSGFELAISDEAGGVYQTLVATGLDGVTVLVECEAVSILADGTTSTQTKAQTLTIQGSRIERGRVFLSLKDVEDDKLGKLYPQHTYSNSQWLGINQDANGFPVPHPIGTGLKFKCANIFSNPARLDSTGNRIWNGAWWYAVCEAPLREFAIISTTASTNVIVTGDVRDYLQVGQPFYVSNDNNTSAGKYTATAISYSAPNSTITCAMTGSAGAVGNVRIMPQVLSVYRNGRLVPSTEYTIELIDYATAQNQIVDSEFASVGQWTTPIGGTGTATISGGTLNLTGDGTITNYGAARLVPTVVGSVLEIPQRHSYYPLHVKVNAGILRVSDFAIAAPGAVVGVGETVIPQQSLLASSSRPFISNYNTGNASNVTVDFCRHAFLTDITGANRPNYPRLVAIKFNSEQVDYTGNDYEITADVAGIESRNVADEIKRLLELTGVTTDSTTFNAAITYANTHKMIVDCAHGRKDQRRTRAIIEDLLFIARASLYRTATGTYAIVQDKTGTSSATLDESQGDLIEVSSFASPPKSKSLALSYRPNPLDPDKLQHTITRSVTGGVLEQDKPRDCEYLRDHEAADRLLCYLALREQYNKTARFKNWLASRTVGDVVTIKSPHVGIGTDTQFWISETDQVPAAIECEAVEYNASVHTYTAATLPTDAQTTYQPDYSKTPPLAPTSLKITAGSTAIAGDGTTTARITIEVFPPTVNWSSVRVWCVHNTTGEITAPVDTTDPDGEATGSELRTGVITGLRAGEVYQLKAQAVNAFNLGGTLQGTFDATAIGGGGAVTTFTAPGYATAPATVSSCTAAQGMGRIVNVSWPTVSGAAVVGYVLERSVSAGAFAEVWRGGGNSYRDTSVTIGTAYQYQVKARDAWGNVSAAWATSGTVTPSSNVTGGSGFDINSNTVGTVNRTAVSTASVLVTNRGSLAVTHGLGKQPTVTTYVNGKGAAPSWVISNSTTSFTVAATVLSDFSHTESAAMAVFTSTNNSVAGDPHTHNMQSGDPIGAFSISADYW